jgi:hypothetical protein
LRVGGQIATVTEKLSGRSDVLVYCASGAGEGAPACFKPTIAEMEIDVDQCFGEGANPSLIMPLNVRRNQFDWPVAMGAITHEAAHAEWSRWSLEDHAKHPDWAEREVVTLFEESRIEGLAARKHPGNVTFLRACALKLVIGDLEEKKTAAAEAIAKGEEPEDVIRSGVWELTQLMLLSMARVDAGVLEETDVELITDKATEVFGEDLVKVLRGIWVEAQAHEDHDEWEPLLVLAKEWLKTLTDAGHDPRAEREAASAAMSAMAEILGAMAEMAEEAEIKATDEGTSVMVRERREEEAREREAVSKEIGKHRKEAEKIFAKNSGPAGVYGTSSILDEERDPKPVERAAANTVGEMLERARYHDRVVDHASSEAPPGRLRNRQAMLADVQRGSGQMVTAEPWATKKRRHIQDPTLDVGIMVDISGSMSAAMEPMAVTAWVFSEAVRRIEGRAAMVYYGGDVFPVLKAGQHLDKVRVYSAPDGTEEFDDAFQALDGELNLLHGSGARLLVIVSDCQYRKDQTPLLRKWLTRCSEAGVGVIILPFERAGLAEQYTDISGVKVLSGFRDPAAVATQIGQVAAEALEIAGGKR